MAMTQLHIETLTINKRIRLAECPVDRLSFEEAVEELCRRIDSGVRTHVVFVNAAKIVKYHQDAALAAVMDRADLLLADGVPVVWASRMLGQRLPSRVNGTDLMERMVAVAAERGYRVFFLGAKPEVIALAVAEFSRRHPALKVAGFRSGYFGKDEEEAVISEINASGADLLLIGMSTPQKELWVDRNLAQLQVGVAQGVGGSFDVIAGLIARAPLWMQRSGLEWFYRLLQEPQRMWRRYLVTNSAFLWLILCDLFRTRKLHSEREV
jgi:N-acetylglucosaminyldiphosphoundecaprenol N-acetyl-beta-D-mannosaminyltransferase